MKHAIRNTQLITILLITSFFLSACSHLKARVPGTDPKEARTLLLNLQNKNYYLKTFKGIGKFKLWNKGKPQAARLAWMGSVPEKLRTEILAVSGQPAISIANDGSWLYFLSHTPHRFYKKRSAKADLEKLISIPITSRDVIALLAGRVPVHEYNTASIMQDEAGDGYVLVLKKRWRGIIEKIYLDEKKTDVRKVEMFDSSGSLVYMVVFERMQNINKYQVPLKLVISNEDIVFQLDIEKYWADIVVSPSMFVLNPSTPQHDKP